MVGKCHFEGLAKKKKKKRSHTCFNISNDSTSCYGGSICKTYEVNGHFSQSNNFNPVKEK